MIFVETVDHYILNLSTMQKVSLYADISKQYTRFYLRCEDELYCVFVLSSEGFIKDFSYKMSSSLANSLLNQLKNLCFHIGFTSQEVLKREMEMWICLDSMPPRES